MRAFIPGLVALLLLAPHSSVHAQTLSACTDFFASNAVTTTIAPSLPQGIQSGKIGFTGTVVNTTTYPIKDVTVWMQIVHTKKGGAQQDIVDFFPVMEHTTLLPNEKKAVETSWTIPLGAEPGDYRAIVIVSASDRFVLSERPYSGDITSGYTDFKVTGESVGALQFIPGSVFVGGTRVKVGEVPVTVPGDMKGVPIQVDLTNTTDLPYQGNVEWNLYTQDNLFERNLLASSEAEVRSHPHSTTTLSYTVRDTEHATYYLEGIITTKGGTHSHIGIRFRRASLSEPHLTFVGIRDDTVFACLQTNGSTPAAKTALSLTVTGAEWYVPFLQIFGLGTYAHATYNGDSPVDMKALTASVNPNRASYAVHAVLSQDGVSKDDFSIVYSCSELGSTCPSVFAQAKALVLPIGIAALIVFVVLFILYLIRKRIEKKRLEALPWNQPPA